MIAYSTRNSALVRVLFFTSFSLSESFFSLLGDPETLLAWKAICEISRYEFEKIYKILDIENLEERGESFYNPLLPSVVSGLKEAGLLVESEGAQCVFLEGYQNADKTPLPLIVQKSDGGTTCFTVRSYYALCTVHSTCIK